MNRKKYKNPFDEFRTASEVYTDLDALRDSLKLRLKILFHLANRPKPNSYYQDKLKLD